MAAETARKFEALEAQARKLMSVFIKAGHEAVSPAIIQPADVFLDVIGEALRARTYVFTDANGDELCLRPDLTVPACRLHLERHPDGDKKARYCYNGVAFRFQPEDAGAAHPREFRQAGIESFGLRDKEKAEAQTVALIAEALRAAGLKKWKLRIGDLGLFRAMLKGAKLPDRWRRRLTHSFWRPDAFRAELKRLTTAPADAGKGLPPRLLDAIDPSDPASAENKVAEFLEAQRIEPTGARTLGEIAECLLARAADAKAEPLARETAALIESYVGVSAPIRAAGDGIEELMRGKGIDLGDALDAFRRRVRLLETSGIDLANAEFSAEFGRNLEYYTGFVFEIVVPSLGAASPVVGGGRYDSLLRAVGAPQYVPAVGGAIHTERLLAAIGGGKA